jgi:hypothetical protein
LTSQPAYDRLANHMKLQDIHLDEEGWPIMHWFGDDWEAPICKETKQVDVPIGEPCLICNKPIQENDRGLLIPFLRGKEESTTMEPHHLDCFRDAIIPK